MTRFVAPTITDLELALRLGLTAALCGAIGLEREVRGQVAGFRTHILVGVGAALFALVSAHGFESFYLPADATYIRPDPSRVAAQVVQGVGFLGAAAIFRHGATVRGLTTAASLWIAAAIGLAVGVGYFLGALIVTAAVLYALLVLRFARPWLTRIREDVAPIRLELAPGGSVAECVDLLDALQVQIDDLSRAGEEHRISVHVPEDTPIQAIVERLRALDGVADASAPTRQAH